MTVELNHRRACVVCIVVSLALVAVAAWDTVTWVTRATVLLASVVVASLGIELRASSPPGPPRT